MVSFAVVIVLTCFKDIAKRHPTNLILLGVFTLAESHLLCLVTSMYTPASVFTAVFTTAAVVVGLTLYTFNSKYDFTEWGPYLFCCLLVLCIGSFFRYAIVLC